VPQLLRLDRRQSNGRKVHPPRFRSRKDKRQAIRFTKNSRFTVQTSGRLRLPKIGGSAQVPAPRRP
jgi:putative transposase